MTIQSATRNAALIIAVIAVGFLIYGILVMPDQRTTTEKVGDAIHELPQGVGKAGRQLEDRTPGEKLGDKIKDNTSSE